MFVGVDSGGSRTCAHLSLPGGAARYRLDTSLGGALSDDAVAPTLLRVLAPLAEHRADGDAVSVWVSAAGYTAHTASVYAAAARAAAAALDLAVVGVANDAVSLLLATGADGVVVAGTGSAVLVADGSGGLRQADAQEWVAGDPGGGFGLGRAGIRRAFADHDGGRATPLLAALHGAYSVDEAGMGALARALAVADDGVKRRIARFAHGVTATAQAGDAAADALVEAAAHELADHTAAMLRRHRADAGRVELVLCGGLWSSSAYLRAWERRAVAALRPATVGRHVLESAAPACVELARRLASGDDVGVALPSAFAATVVRR